MKMTTRRFEECKKRWVAVFFLRNKGFARSAVEANERYILDALAFNLPIDLVPALHVYFIFLFLGTELGIWSVEAKRKCAAAWVASGQRCFVVVLGPTFAVLSVCRHVYVSKIRLFLRQTCCQF